MSIQNWVDLNEALHEITYSIDWIDETKKMQLLRWVTWQMIGKHNIEGEQ